MQQKNSFFRVFSYESLVSQLFFFPLFHLHKERKREEEEESDANQELTATNNAMHYISRLVKKIRLVITMPKTEEDGFRKPLWLRDREKRCPRASRGQTDRPTDRDTRDTNLNLMACFLRKGGRKKRESKAHERESAQREKVIKRN